MRISRTTSIEEWWVIGHIAQRLWTLRASDTEGDLRVPPVIVPYLRLSIDPFPTRTDTSIRRGMKYIGNFSIHSSSSRLQKRTANAGLLPRLFRFGSRSATATPTGSPKKRQLPQIPAALKERVAQDLEERARFMRHRNRQSIYRSTGMGGELVWTSLSKKNWCFKF